ncbi:unnamed protein product, partial [marine sediment metagenome]
KFHLENQIHIATYNNTTHTIILHLCEGAE